MSKSLIDLLLTAVVVDKPAVEPGTESGTILSAFHTILALNGFLGSAASRFHVSLGLGKLLHLEQQLAAALFLNLLAVLANEDWEVLVVSVFEMPNAEEFDWHLA